jgi:hypothetical protein
MQDSIENILQKYSVFSWAYSSRYRGLILVPEKCSFKQSIKSQAPKLACIQTHRSCRVKFLERFACLTTRWNSRYMRLIARQKGLQFLPWDSVLALKKRNGRVRQLRQTFQRISVFETSNSIKVAISALTKGENPTRIMLRVYTSKTCFRFPTLQPRI